MHREAQRINIPTAELEAFAEEHEKKPNQLLYPRDPTLDPQLVWKGKDDLDRSDLTVPAVPIYIQEKISPQALIEDLRAEKKRNAAEHQIDLFGAFNGLEFEQVVDFYQHNQQWTNRMVLGDSLLVMASLAEKEQLKGKVQMIYMDPPYGIKFGSNWQVSTRKRDVHDGRPEDATRQPEQVRAFRDTWQLGVHSYLAYLRDRLAVARDLLTGTGSIFLQIGDQNMHLVRSTLDEVFGSDNFIATITFKTGSGFVGRYIKTTSDYLLWYGANAEISKFHRLFTDKAAGLDTYFDKVQFADGTVQDISDDGEIPGDATPVALRPLVSAYSPNTNYRYTFRGREYYCGAARCWKTTPDGMDRLAIDNRIVASENTLKFVARLSDFPYEEITHVWEDTMELLAKRFVVQTTTKVIERCILMTSDPGDLVLDPTCGSGTTAFVAEQWGRRWITIDTSRVALALARTRLMAARFPYYVLADSESGATREAELEGRVPGHNATFAGDVSRGFVYERVPHITLKSIANNLDIREGMSREEIKGAIARHTETEILHDRPLVDPKVVRVTGPLTVESLSPHRVLPPDASSDSIVVEGDVGRFLDRIIDYLRKAGVQNTVKDERLTFDRLDSWPGGIYIQAVGEYTENEKRRAVAVSIGPEYGTVGPEHVREAAKECVKIADLLVVCGFAFEPLVGEEAGHLGRLTILKARMNPDLSMGDELLKKTGAANLFMVFGEPDIVIQQDGNAQLTAEIRGLDVYDPTTGVIRSHSTDDIACWFIDTDYNGESFFVRHAYFLGAGDPYDKLKRALRAEIDEATWSTLYSTRSRPFAKPTTGKIAVKVINHYGDEVVRVYPVSA